MFLAQPKTDKTPTFEMADHLLANFESRKPGIVKTTYFPLPLPYPIPNRNLYRKLKVFSHSSVLQGSVFRSCRVVKFRKSTVNFKERAYDVGTMKLAREVHGGNLKSFLPFLFVP